MTEEDDTVPEHGRIPTIPELIAAGAICAGKLKRATEGTFLLWLDQAERLAIARDHHDYRGDAFKQFAAKIGIDHSSAKRLVKLYIYKDRVLAHFKAEAEKATMRREGFAWPGWERALKKMEAEYEPKPKRANIKSPAVVEDADPFGPVERAELVSQIAMFEQRDKSLQSDKDDLRERLAAAHKKIEELETKLAKYEPPMGVAFMPPGAVSGVGSVPFLKRKSKSPPSDVPEFVTAPSTATSLIVAGAATTTKETVRAPDFVIPLSSRSRPVPSDAATLGGVKSEPDQGRDDDEEPAEVIHWRSGLYFAKTPTGFNLKRLDRLVPEGEDPYERFLVLLDSLHPTKGPQPKYPGQQPGDVGFWWDERHIIYRRDGTFKRAKTVP